MTLFLEDKIFMTHVEHQILNYVVLENFKIYLHVIIDMKTNLVQFSKNLFSIYAL